MPWRPNGLLLSLLAGALLPTCGSQAAPFVDDVMLRPHPDYAPTGLPLGSFRVFPSLDASANYDDNIYRRQDKVDDSILVLAPQVSAESNWSLHQFDLRGGLVDSEYVNHGSENATDWNIVGDGRLDLPKGTVFRLKAGTAQLHEARTSPDQPFLAAKPTVFDLTLASASLRYQPGQLGIEIGGDLFRYGYGRTLIISGPPISNADRERTIYDGYVRAMYDISPGYSLFVRGTYGEHSFDQYFDRNGFNRNSTEYSLNAGVALEITSLLTGEASLQYSSHKSTAPLPNVDGLAAAVSLSWYVSPLITLHLDAVRNFNDTVIPGAAIRDDRSVALRADHELLRNVILHSKVEYVDSQFKGNGQEEETISLEFSGDYLLNRYLALNLGYTYADRSSNVAVRRYNDSRVMVKATSHL